MFLELALPLGFLRLKQRLPFAYDLGSLVYPTIESAHFLFALPPVVPVTVHFAGGTEVD